MAERKSQAEVINLVSDDDNEEQVQQRKMVSTKKTIPAPNSICKLHPDEKEKMLFLIHLLTNGRSQKKESIIIPKKIAITVISLAFTQVIQNNNKGLQYLMIVYDPNDAQLIKDETIKLQNYQYYQSRERDDRFNACTNVYGDVKRPRGAALKNDTAFLIVTPGKGSQICEDPNIRFNNLKAVIFYEIDQDKERNKAKINGILNKITKSKQSIIQVSINCPDDYDGVYHQFNQNYYDSSRNGSYRYDRRVNNSKRSTFEFMDDGERRGRRGRTKRDKSSEIANNDRSRSRDNGRHSNDQQKLYARDIGAKYDERSAKLDEMNKEMTKLIMEHKYEEAKTMFKEIEIFQKKVKEVKKVWDRYRYRCWN